MQQIIKNREITDDTWKHIGLDDEIVDGNIIVPLKRWHSQRDHLAQHNGQIGISIQGDDLVEDLQNDLTDIKLIAINFPAFKDGRGYSQARLLRERYGYQGEIRATGNILRDQLFYLYRCGFDAYELEAGKSFEDALNGFNDFSVKYQAACDGPATPNI